MRFVLLLLISVVFPVLFPSGDRKVLLNDTDHQVDFKSHQWFGATVRSHGDTILVSPTSRGPDFRWLGEDLRADRVLSQLLCQSDVRAER